jgi:hypothetical protein
LQLHTTFYTNLLFQTQIIPLHHINMSGNSNVGNAGVYEAGDQRTVSNSVIEEEKKENRFHEGKDNSHKAQDPSMFILLFVAALKAREPTNDIHLSSVLSNQTLTTAQRTSVPSRTSSNARRSVRTRVRRCQLTSSADSKTLLCLLAHTATSPVREQRSTNRSGKKRRQS